jgi:hypothetical protein
MKTGLPLFLSLSLLGALLTACGGGGEYGYAREYQTSGDEGAYLARAEVVSYEDVKRDPADYERTLLEWFGVVTSVERDASGKTMVHLTHRIHQDRHLCSDETSGSCRVTVSDRQSGPFSAIVELRPGDADGDTRMWTGSLVRIYGHPTGDFDVEGGPVIAAEHYRHWPRGTYVTTGAAGSMRR